MSNKTTRKGESRSDQDTLALMETWERPSFLRRGWHQVANLRMRQALKGGPNVVIVGDPGTGKTMGVKRVIRSLTDKLAEGGSTLEPVDNPILHVTGSRARGTKTALMDLLHALRGFALTNSEKRQYTARGALSLIIDEMRERNVRLLCIDEAQMMDRQNAELIRQIPDLGDDKGYSARLCLIGTPKLKELLSWTGERGQRFAWEIEVRSLSLKDLQSHVLGFHPALSGVKESLSDKEWDRVLKYLYDRTGGNLRRLSSVLQGANSVGVELGQPLSAEHLRRSADDLAPE